MSRARVPQHTTSNFLFALWSLITAAGIDYSKQIEEAGEFCGESGIRQNQAGERSTGKLWTRLPGAAEDRRQGEYNVRDNSARRLIQTRHSVRTEASSRADDDAAVLAPGQKEPMSAAGSWR